MKAFLSHSSVDKWYVSKVFAQLGETQSEYDEKTFDYTFNVQAIREALARSDLFVYFLSKNSINSSFVDEEQKAALEKRGRGTIKRVIIVSIDDTPYSALPEWMRDINIIQKISSPKACARRIQSVLWNLSAEEDQSEDLYLGRDKDEAVLRRALAKPASETPIYTRSWISWNW